MGAKDEREYIDPTALAPLLPWDEDEPPEPCALCGDPECFAHVSADELAEMEAGKVGGVTLTREALAAFEERERLERLARYGTDDAGYALVQAARELAAIFGASSGPES